MTKPLALVFYEKLLPGSRIAHRLSDLGWRVTEAKLASEVATLARSQKPLLIVAELALRNGDFCPVIRELHQGADTNHIPVLAYGDPQKTKVIEAAVAAGAKLVAAEAGIIDQLPQLLEHVLAVD